MTSTTRDEQARRLSKRQVRTAAKYRAARSMATEARRLFTDTSESWAQEHKAIAAAVRAISDRLDREANRIAERCPWVVAWEPTSEDAI